MKSYYAYFRNKIFKIAMGGIAVRPHGINFGSKFNFAWSGEYF